MEWVTLNTKRSTSAAKLAPTPTLSSSLSDRLARSEADMAKMRVRVLGSAAGAVSPSGNCVCPNCSGLRDGTVRPVHVPRLRFAVSSDHHTGFSSTLSPICATNSCDLTVRAQALTGPSRGRYSGTNAIPTGGNRPRLRSEDSTRISRMSASDRARRSERLELRVGVGANFAAEVISSCEG